MSGFRLGFLTHVHGPGRDLADVLSDVVTLFAAAEEFGFDGGWVAQHHLRPDFGRLPSPHVLFGAVSARAPRLRLGTAVTVLPLEPPLRLAEDLAVLDALTGGRVEVGVGTGGANTAAFRAFGLDPDDRRPLYDDKLTFLRSALRGDPLPGGEVLRPRAAGLAERIWQSTSDPVRAAAAGAAGDGLLLGTATHDPSTVQRPLAEAYLATATRPRIGVVRAVFPDTPIAELAPALEIHRKAFPELAGLTPAEHLARVNAHIGPVEDVITGLEADPALLDLLTPDGWFLPVVSHELSTVEQDVERLRVVATRVAPALGWRP